MPHRDFVTSGSVNSLFAFIGRAGSICAGCLFLLAGCLPWRGEWTSRSSGVEVVSGTRKPMHTVYVVGHGWHTGLVLKADEIDPDDWPGSHIARGGRFVEIGWGDEGFYRAKSFSLTVAVRAIFTPTPSVLHVVRFDPLPERVFVGSDVVKLNVSEADFRQLCRFLHKSFELGDNGEPKSLGPGIYGGGQFYRGRGKYYYPKTCNVWTANALKTAGVPIVPALSTTAGGVIGQVQSQGRVLSKSSPFAMIHAFAGTAAKSE